MREGEYVRAFGVALEGVDPRSPEGAIGILTRMHPSWWWEVTFGDVKQLVYKGNLHPMSDLEILHIMGNGNEVKPI